MQSKASWWERAIIGLAVARVLAQAGDDVIVLEAEGRIGNHTSSRNSGVIHAGIYYPQGSLKARLCVAGREMLYAYSKSHGVPYRRCGKLIVAAKLEELLALDAIRTKATENGIDDLDFLDSTQALRLEPELTCVGALMSPSTGIVDSHSLMLAIQGDAEDSGAIIAYHTPFERARLHNGGFVVQVGGSEPMTLEARKLVNAAGLWAPMVAGAIEGLPESSIPGSYFARGNYFSLSGRAPFSRLVYPVPEPGGLGIHLTLDLGGQARFGPDVEWIDGISYEVNPERSREFYAAIRKYWPGLKDGALTPAYAGIRPKITGPNEPGADFRISGPGDHGVHGLVNLFAIESPGLTSSLALADEVASALLH